MKFITLPGSPSKLLAADFWLSHESTNRKQCLVKSLPVQRAPHNPEESINRLPRPTKRAVHRARLFHSVGFFPVRHRC